MAANTSTSNNSLSDTNCTHITIVKTYNSYYLLAINIPCCLLVIGKSTVVKSNIKILNISTNLYMEFASS